MSRPSPSSSETSVSNCFWPLLDVAVRSCRSLSSDGLEPCFFVQERNASSISGGSVGDSSAGMLSGDFARLLA